MRAARPTTIAALVAIRARSPQWQVIAGGTDLMVEANFGRCRPEGLIDVTGVEDLSRISVSASGVRIGAAVTFEALEFSREPRLAGLALAARAVASPQIRSTATIGGNLGTASPAGDAHPVLVAADAVVELASVHGRRRVAYRDFFLGPGRSVLRPDEVIVGIELPLSDATSQQFSKIGTRNAMVISVAAVGVVIDWNRKTVGVGLGSVGPTPICAVNAQDQLASVLWPRGEGSAPPALSRTQIDEFAELTAAAATPIDDVRGTASYRRHVVQTMARRTVTWIVADRQRRAS